MFQISIRGFPPIYKSLGASGSQVLRIPALSSKPHTFVDGKEAIQGTLRTRKALPSHSTPSEPP